MTDTNAPCPLGDALAQLDSAGWEVVRAHLSRLEEQLAQAQAGMRRRGDDMIVPMRLLDEINASGYAWKVRAEAAEAEVERLRADGMRLDSGAITMLDRDEFGDPIAARRSMPEYVMRRWTAWLVVTRSGHMVVFTIAPTRREAIARMCNDPKVWRQWKRWGFRCVRVRILAIGEDG